ncbi:MAG: SUMF1/EgtB/PvdO family nonheme iron enzyme [Candidatus Wallbacteria bacterium]|nr:SUMF1/EgtB/PvdO family nonheme iron enzyme [Candidatus Wallbacteria bacterium]
MSQTPCPNCGQLVGLLRRGGGFECPSCGWSMTPAGGEPARQVEGLPREWQVEGVLGEGGMGTVWRARNQLTEEPVAIKCMRELPGAGDEGRQRFLREVKVLCRLSHPGIVRMVHAGLLATGTPYLVLELIDGLTLRERLGGMELEQALEMSLAIAKALEYTHSRGVVHRDLKPENVLIDGAGRVKVADFGLAGLDAEWGDAQRVMKTRVGTAMGTPGYMAPEQVGNAGEAGPAADIYALGAMLFEMLCGRLPHGTEVPVGAGGELPEGLGRLVERMLSRQPAERPAAGEVRRALEGFAAGRAASGAQEADSEWINARDGSTMMRIAAGRFRMGSERGRADEQPVREVTLSAYSIARYATTWGQYRAFCAATGRAEPPDPGFPHGDDHPVVNVSWDDAAAYCAWAGLRLPTEAEWERAARGGDGRTYPWGERPPDDSLANFDSRHGATRPVGSYPDGVSPAGCWEMAGNVWEWTADWYGPYPNGPVTDPRGPEAGGRRVLRGGGWCYEGASLRASCREALDPAARIFEFGFRPAGPNR